MKTLWRKYSLVHDKVPKETKTPRFSRGVNKFVAPASVHARISSTTATTTPDSMPTAHSKPPTCMYILFTVHIITNMLSHHCTRCPERSHAGHAHSASVPGTIPASSYHEPSTELLNRQKIVHPAAAAPIPCARCLRAATTVTRYPKAMMCWHGC